MQSKKKLIVAQLNNKFPAFTETMKYIFVLKEDLMREINLVHIQKTLFSLKSTFIYYPSFYV